MSEQGTPSDRRMIKPSHMSRGKVCGTQDRADGKSTVHKGGRGGVCWTQGSTDGKSTVHTWATGKVRGTQGITDGKPTG